jgi:lysophospholipase L1-like esterase
LLLVAPAAGLLLLALAAISPAARIIGCNASMWLVARASPRLLPAWQRTIDPLIPRGVVLVSGDSIAAQLPPDWVAPDAVNLGIGGIGVRQLAQQLPRLGSLARARAVVIIIGTNDLVNVSAPPPGLAGELTRLLERIPPLIPVLLCAVPPVDPQLNVERRPDVITELNARWAKVAAGRPHASFIPLAPALSDASGRLRADFDAGDGLHLNSAGNRALAAAIRHAIASSNR